jgi:exodeoxyribonuclease VII large subunit
MGGAMPQGEFGFNSSKDRFPAEKKPPAPAHEPPAESAPGENILTVTQVTKIIKDVLDRGVGKVWVVGEVSRPTYNASGHVYFTMKDAGAQLPAACFRGVAGRLKFKLEQGMEVVAFGRIDVYLPHGKYQLIVERIEPKGVGALQIAFEQLKKKLEAEGLFKQERKRPMPFLPMNIGIVTSPTGAAIRDILNILDRRFPRVHVRIYPVRVQGEGAAAEIAAAIADFNSLPELSDTEVLIVGRGGGSIEDLWPFNEEITARAIAASRIPVISAVGHEIDYTISDFVADLRAPTPSAAAEMVLPAWDDLVGTLEKNRRRLDLALQNTVGFLTMEVSRIARTRVFRMPFERIEGEMQTLDDLNRSAANAVKNILARTKDKAAASAARLENLSPLKVLGRGYSVTTGASGAVLKDSRSASAGDTVFTRLAKGAIESRIVEVKHDGEKKKI